MPKVSIIVPNYNHASYLNQRLDSIFNQIFEDFEVILLDDASTDISVSILKKYAEDKRVSHFIVNKDNSGSPFKQWKKGLDLAKGEYIWIAESDDSCDINFLEEQIKKLTEYDVTVAKTLLLSDGELTEKELKHHFCSTYSINNLNPEHFIEHSPIGNVSAVLFKNFDKRKLKNLAFSNYKYIGDVVFYYEVFNEKKITFNEKSISYFRVNNQSVSSINTKGIKYFKVYFKEHCKFITWLNKNESEIYKKNKKKYIKTKFNKVRNRLSFKEKLSLNFLLIFFRYHYCKLQ